MLQAKLLPEIASNCIEPSVRRLCDRNAGLDHRVGVSGAHTVIAALAGLDGDDFSKPTSAGTKVV